MNDATQTGVAMAAIAMISTVIGLIVGYFKDRDKLRHDVEMAAIRNQNGMQAQQIATLQEANLECELKGQERDQRIAKLEQALTDHLNRGTAQRAALPPTA